MTHCGRGLHRNDGHVTPGRFSRGKHPQTRGASPHSPCDVYLRAVVRLFDSVIRTQMAGVWAESRRADFEEKNEGKSGGGGQCFRFRVFGGNKNARAIGHRANRGTAFTWYATGELKTPPSSYHVCDPVVKVSQAQLVGCSL